MMKTRILSILALLLMAVTGATAQTYSVTLADGTEDAANWTISPARATEGETVTIKYTGAKKVKSVKAVKKAAPTYTLLSAATAEDCGKVVCADGHLHDAKTAVPAGCTAVGILGKVTETGHGLIIALKDATSQKWNTINGWTSETTYAGTTLKLLPDDAARGTNLTSYTVLGETAVSNWAVAQKSDYEAIFTNLGSTTGDGDGHTYDSNVNDYITTGVVRQCLATIFQPRATVATLYGTSPARNGVSPFRRLPVMSGPCSASDRLIHLPIYLF